MSFSKQSLNFFLAATVALCVGSLASAAVCPSTTNTNTDCGFIFTVGTGGTITGASVAGAHPYDGSDDALLGIVNNSGSTYTGSFSLTGSGNGGGLFAFDGDGICVYVSASYCSTAATGYEGPLVTFSKIGPGGSTGTVTVTGLAAGATTYFSLEGSPASIAPSLSPEPASFALMGASLLAFGCYAFRRKRMNS